jgi:hypothetical protein
MFILTGDFGFWILDFGFWILLDNRPFTLTLLPSYPPTLSPAYFTSLSNKLIHSRSIPSVPVQKIDRVRRETANSFNLSSS